MDAYDLFWAIKTQWMEHTDTNKNSGGSIVKKNTHMAVVVPTEYGYREVIGVKWNSEVNAIELILDNK